MCRQTEREPGEEKPKWIHSLSWMEEERRREGDVRASFNCLCPVKSAQTPGAAPGSGVRADFRVELPIKPLTATTLLWHRHVSSCSTTLTFTVFPHSSPVTFKTIWKCSSHLRPAALSSTALSSGTRVRVWAGLKIARPRIASEALGRSPRGPRTPRLLLPRGAPGPRGALGLKQSRDVPDVPDGAALSALPRGEGRSPRRRTAPGGRRESTAPLPGMLRGFPVPGGAAGRALRGSAFGMRWARSGRGRGFPGSLPPPVGAARPLLPRRCAPAPGPIPGKGGRPRGDPRTPKARPHRRQRRRIAGLGSGCAGSAPGQVDNKSSIPLTARRCLLMRLRLLGKARISHIGSF